MYRLVDERGRTGPAQLAGARVDHQPPAAAELRPDQKDEDSLPAYEILDRILAGYVEDDLGREQLVDRGLDRETVHRVIRLVDLAEYKRRQNPPGSASRRARSGATGASRSPTGTAANAPRAPSPAARPSNRCA